MRAKIVAIASGLIVFTLLWVSGSFAAQALLTDDAYTDSTKPNTHFGNTATLLINNATAFIKFDLSTLPAGVVGADIEKANLILFVASVKTAGAFDVVRVTSGWDESTITFNNSPTLGSTEVSSIGVTH